MTQSNRPRVMTLAEYDAAMRGDPVEWFWPEDEVQETAPQSVLLAVAFSIGVMVGCVVAIVVMGGLS